MGIQPVAMGSRLSLLAGFLILINVALLGTNEFLTRKLLGPLVMVFELDTLRALIPLWTALGIGIVACSLLLFLRPEQHKYWGAFIAVCGVSSLMIGGGFVFGAVFSVVSGFSAFVWGPSSRISGE